jgi:RNA polymerase sigma-70 factor, ECF subfamily
LRYTGYIVSFLSKQQINNNDAELVAKAKADHRCFSLLYDKYYRNIFLFVLRRVNDKHQCSDIVSEVFLKALLNIKIYTDRGFPFSSWLYRIAINEVNSYFRAQKKSMEVDIDIADFKKLFAEAEISNNNDNINAMLACLEKLEEEQANLIELRFFDNLSFAEIAAVYGISEANAKMKLYRLLEKLKKMIISTFENEG